MAQSLSTGWDPMRLLSIEQANETVTHVREAHGLGHKYALKVAEAAPGRWRLVEHSGRMTELAAMSERDFEHWLNRFFIEAIAEHDETSEG